MPTNQPEPLYANTIRIDQETGLPADYNSLAIGYRNLVLAAADRVGIPHQDAEDAAQEILTKFWIKGGLDFYKPDEFTVSGRKPKFASMFRSWTSMFMLQERDKTHKNQNRNYHIGDVAQMPDKPVPAVDDEVLDQDAANQWIAKAQRIILEKNPALLAVFEACLSAASRGAVVTRADVVQATDGEVQLRQASAALKQLRALLQEAGMGADSLHDIH